MTTIAFAKGHGTENDFVILHDPDARIAVDPSLIRGLCDRRAGIGADGVLRVARTRALVEAGVISAVPESVSPESWFMDYRNADGTTAEMCGNGVRVFAHWLASRGHVTGRTFDVGTRAGNRPVSVGDVTKRQATVTVSMGTPTLLGVSDCMLGRTTMTGLAVDCGNPHLACVVPGLNLDGLKDLAVDAGFEFDRDFFPDGVNIEIATALDDNDHAFMRVHERGAGETRACGTGTVATAVALLADTGRTCGHVIITEPGGSLEVTITDDGAATLTGPSVIVAEGTVDTQMVTDWRGN
ncbi:diaminopimelate epimerase [Corynebacterium mendelii]|uniref:Diaminopimelate epimerase n=1 Tax=Corynebacterium mendelii TaxID=2765362 RepID=A0A939IX54_9CORY|nr:diaminopimelate epimerase [Corynebacterium mendelii]MBN9643312.1 diaminopimelate epimerase [Corynebacterium mendelii]